MSDIRNFSPVGPRSLDGVQWTLPRSKTRIELALLFRTLRIWIVTDMAESGCKTFNVSPEAGLFAMTARADAIKACRNSPADMNLTKEGQNLVDEVVRTDRHAALHFLTSFFLKYFEKEDRDKVLRLSELELRQINADEFPEAIGLDVKSATLEALRGVLRLHLRNNRFKQYRWTF